MLNTGMNNLQLGAQPPWAGQMHLYQNAYGQYPQAYQQYGGARFPDSQARVIQQRRMQNNEGKISVHLNESFRQIPNSTNRAGAFQLGQP